MRVATVIFFIFNLWGFSYSDTPPLPGDGNSVPFIRKMWVLLIASSQGYYNYRHQADICHTYQVLHKNGIPDENIIVMMADDIANDPSNPTPGIIINSPGGPNVYDGVPKDYTGKLVTPENFLNVLSGNKKAMEGIGSGRVIESGPDDHVFVNFVDHGGPGVLLFSEKVLTADDLVSTLSSMAAKSQFAKMVWYVEACHAGSIFDDILPDDLDIFVMTAADPHESSFACYYDEKRGTYLGDVFSVTWLNDTQYESLPSESLHHQFEKVRTKTNTSHVEEYGDLDIGVTKLSEIIGFNMQEPDSKTAPSPPMMKCEPSAHLVRRSNGFRSPKPWCVKDVVSNMDVPLEILNHKFRAAQDDDERTNITMKKNHLLKKRSTVDEIMNRIVAIASSGDESKKSELKTSFYKLGKKNFPCYKVLLEEFSKRCLDIAKNTYVRFHLTKLVNMCASTWLTTEEAVNSIKYACRTPIKGYTAIL